MVIPRMCAPSIRRSTTSTGCWSPFLLRRRSRSCSTCTVTTTTTSTTSSSYQLATDYATGRLADALQGAPAELSEYLARIYDTYLHELAAFPLATRAFVIESRAAGAPSQEHRRAVADQFAELFRIPGSDDDPQLRTAVVAASDELITREIADNGTEQLSRLCPTLVELGMRLLTSTPATL